MAKAQKAYSYTVRPFMTRLGLRGNALAIFATIYSFTNGESGMYWGSQAYLSSALNISMRNIQYNLKKLKDAGYIEKLCDEKGRRGYAAIVDDDEKPSFKYPTRAELENKRIKIVTLGRKGLVQMSEEQLLHLRTLIDEDVIAKYIIRLEVMVEEAIAEERPFFCNFYKTIKKWIYEDYTLTEEDLKK